MSIQSRPAFASLFSGNPSNRVTFLALTFYILTALGTSEAAEVGLISQAGFTQIDPVNFYFRKTGDKMDLTSSRARLWSVFQPASQQPESKPLFVFFNGGPACATTSGLMSLNTGPMTLDPQRTGTKKIAKTAAPWTDLGNVLYVDAREAGFSYNLTKNVESETTRWKEFDAQNYNCFLDAADVIRLLLRFLSRNPVLKKNPVVLVGESYGGIRATVMLHILLNYRDYASDKTVYQDKSLVQEIQAYYNSVFPGYRDKRVPPAVIAKRFGAQVLIEPLLTGVYQDSVSGRLFEKEGSVIYKIAADTGSEFTPCGDNRDCDPRYNALNFVYNTARRDVYCYPKPQGWLDRLMDQAQNRMQYTEILSNLTDTEVTSIDEMYAANRTNAYRYTMARSDGTLEDRFDLSRLPLVQQLLLKSRQEICREHAQGSVGDLVSVFGALKPWDEYQVGCNDPAFNAFYDNKAIYRGYAIDPLQPIYGKMFLKNLAHVKTFITNASYDLVVYAPSIPGALAKHNDIIESARHDTRPRSGVARPGWIALKYKSRAFPDEPDLKSRTIRFPVYKTSAHAVTANQPEELRSDVAAWLGKN